MIADDPVITAEVHGKAVSDLNTVLTQARAVPHFDHGRYQKLELQNADADPVVESIARLESNRESSGKVVSIERQVSPLLKEDAWMTILKLRSGQKSILFAIDM